MLQNLVPFRKGSHPMRYRVEEFPLLGLQQQMNRLFDDFFGDFSLELPGVRPKDRLFVPTMDVAETDKEITVTAELPGLDQKDVEINLTDNLLTITGQKKHEQEQKDAHSYRMERSFGSFERSIELPSEVNKDQVSAEFKKGILKIRLPKIEPQKPQGKKIEIQGQ